MYGGSYPCPPDGLNQNPPIGEFLKWGYPQFIQVHRVFHYKPSIYGVPHFRKPPIVLEWNNPTAASKA